MEHPVVIIEDEVKIARLLQDYCEDAGYRTEVFHNGDEALAWLTQNPARLVLLDLMLPGTDGLTICQEYRKQSDVPVIMITAKVEEIDRLLGLGLGADDYICKPFSPREVTARIKSILRRVENPRAPVSGLSLDESSFRIRFKDRVTQLTSVEFLLLKTMHDAPGRIFSRDNLMSQIYTDYRVVSDRTIDSHIKKLRKKLTEIDLPDQVIHSVYGAGYKFESV
jgi:two-component system, OmpR family, response regulator BaeR